MKRRQAIKQTAVLAALGGSLSSLLQSCRSETIAEWKPQFLQESEASLIRSIIDTVIPKTDTPGGLDVKVDVFLDLVFAKLNDEEGQKSIRNSLIELDKDCQSMMGAPFVTLDQSKREDFLIKQEALSPKFSPGVWGLPVGEQEPVGFFRSLKSIIVWAYCSSEEVGKNVLNYDPIPQEFVGCVSLSEVGNVWSL